MLLNFGPIIGLGAFFVQAQQVSLEAFLATLPCGIMLFSMIIINEIPDLKEDKRAGKLTLVARFGKKVGLKLYIISWIFTYCVVLFSVLFSFLPWPVLLSFISLPFVFDSIRILVKNYSHPVRLFLSNKRMIHAHALTSFGIIFGYMWHGFSQNTSVFQMYLFVIILLFLYVPSLFPPLQLKREK
jgi:1,4-dihydroxy-2-naphthoate octaprenyltransferase